MIELILMLLYVIAQVTAAAVYLVCRFNVPIEARKRWMQWDGVLLWPVIAVGLYKAARWMWAVL